MAGRFSFLRGGLRGAIGLRPEFLVLTRGNIICQPLVAMYFTFACSNCGKSLRASAENAGRKARCPYCKTSVYIPVSPIASGPLDQESAAPPGEKVPTSPGVQVATATANRPRTTVRRPATRRHRAGEKMDSTNVNMLHTALIGMLLTAVFYALIFPLPHSYFRELFYNRGWVTIGESFLLFWSIGILVLKGRKLLRQRDAMLLDVLPESLAKKITLKDLDKFSHHIADLPVDPLFSFLVRRVVRGLEHFSVRRSASEVGTVLASQSEIDAHAVNSSYAMLNVFIWAIPILGFIGTVQGLGTAVGSLGVQDATDINSIKESLTSITGGLSVAFDTTLVALIMSLMLKFPASSLQKAEEDVLNSVDEYCNENLLKRLQEEPEPDQPRDELSRRIQQAVDAAMAGHHAELRSWSVKLSEIGQSLTREVVKGWSTIHTDLQQEHAQRLAQINEAVGGVGQLLERIAEGTGRLAELQQAQAQQAATVGSTLASCVQSVESSAAGQLARIEAQLAQAIDATRAQLQELTTQTEAAHHQVATVTQQSVEASRASLAGLQDGLRGLNEVLADLGQKQVVIRSEAPPRRRWSLFGRRNHQDR